MRVEMVFRRLMAEKSFIKLRKNNNSDVTIVLKGYICIKMGKSEVFSEVYDENSRYISKVMTSLKIFSFVPGIYE